MADLGSMNLTVGADISGLVSALDKVEDKVEMVGDAAEKTAAPFKKMEDSIKKSSSAAPIQTLNKAMDETRSKIEGINKTAAGTGKGLGNIKPGADQAGQSLVNLGRIAQDAPFGFIGIQNNINPLLESFQRLKVETGSTGGALKALAGSLSGAAGLGLAVSVATGLLTVLSQNGFFNAGEKAKKAADETKRFNDAIKGVGEEAAKEQANVLILVKALGDENVSRREKLSAIKELQSINPKYFGELKLEGELVTGLSIAYDKYKNSIIATIQNKIDSKKLEIVLEKINSLTEQQQQNQITIASNVQQINQLYKQGGAQYANQLKNINLALSKTTELARAEKLRDEILARIAGRNFEGQTSVELEKTKKSAESAAKAIEKIKVGLERVGISIKISSSEEILQELKKAADEANAKLGNDKRIKPLRIPFRLTAEGFQPNSSQYDFPEKQSDNYLQRLIAFHQRVAQANQTAADGFRQTFDDAFSSIGESIGQSLADGANIGQAIFGNLFKIIGAGMVQLGKAMIGIGTAKTVLEKFQFTPGAATIIAGIATIALGTLLQSAIPKFATGTQNFRGGLAMVGERGPELVSLPRGSNVTPNDKLGRIGGGTAVNVNIAGVVRGNDLQLILAKTGRANNRAY